MNISGRWVCFNCRTDGAPMYETNAAGQKIKIKLGVPMRKLEVFRKGRFGGKGKRIAEALVCQNCYDLGFNKVPLGGFNGFVPASKPLPEGVLKMLREAKEKAQKMKDEGVKPVSPQSASTPSLSEHETKHKQPEKPETQSPQ